MALQNAVFLDVGCYIGETLAEVLKPCYGFKAIFAFEPLPSLANQIHYQDPRLTICHYGLGDHTGSVTMYGEANGGTSIYAEKNDITASVTTQCVLIEASRFFRTHIFASDTNILKLNVEGAEIPILNNLIDSGEIWKLANVMIDFDIVKVPGHEHERDDLLTRLEEIGFTRYSLREDVMTNYDEDATHADRIKQWLTSIGLGDSQ